MFLFEKREKVSKLMGYIWMGKISWIGAAAILAMASAAQAGNDGDGGRFLHLLQGSVLPSESQPLVAKPASPEPAAAPNAAIGTRARVPRPAAKPNAPGGPSAFSALIAHHASDNGVPVALGDAVVQIESRYNAHIVHAGNFGLMQIRAQTARGVGFSGAPSGLLDPETNLRYGMKYLALAWHKAGGDTCRALMLYQSGIGAHAPNSANRAYCSKAQRIMASR